MNLTVVVIVVVVAGFMAWAVSTSRRQSERKKQAIADLQEQQEQLATFDIHALVADEVDDLRLREIIGSAQIPDSILLKSWKQSQSVVQGCPSSDMLKFVVADGVDSSAATGDDVVLVCDDLIDGGQAPTATRVDPVEDVGGAPNPSDPEPPSEPNQPSN